MAIVDAKEHVKARYGRIAEKSGSCCAPAPEAATPCCGGTLQESMSQKVGYSADELATIPGGANLGLGCGNPVALASLAAGETVLDLGSGAGIDCFLAANKVGAKGRVIGVDMTDAMLAKARANATAGGYTNVEFRKGEIEALPVEDGIVDVIISNCVINLAADKGT
ncbi:MAG: methyltransferase domain-containing protein, partial [Candidatus Hydrogenedentota bacterium]